MRSSGLRGAYGADIVGSYGRLVLWRGIGALLELRSRNINEIRISWSLSEMFISGGEIKLQVLGQAYGNKPALSLFIRVKE
jgi:hypothetical protein